MSDEIQRLIIFVSCFDYSVLDGAAT